MGDFRRKMGLEKQKLCYNREEMFTKNGKMQQVLQGCITK